MSDQRLSVEVTMPKGILPSRGIHERFDGLLLHGGEFQNWSPAIGDENSIVEWYLFLDRQAADRFASSAIQTFRDGLDRCFGQAFAVKWPGGQVTGTIGEGNPAIKANQRAN